jgi:hypothetical protein
MKYAKEMGVPVFLIGHITKDGSLAGPKVLEHMVDTVLQFEGDRHNTYRILRTMKNRFGSTSELGIYEMQGTGLRQVSNPSEILISQRDEPVSGIAIGSMMEGNRPITGGDPVARERCYLWNAAAEQYRLRRETPANVAGCSGKKGRFQAWRSGCFPECRRRAESGRSRD